jgi:hypothetical protein
MDQLQFGRHDQLAADNAGFIGEALTISSLGAGLLSMLVHTALTASLFLVFRRPYKLSVDAATVGMICAGRATDEMLGLVLGRIVDAFTDVPTARNHFCGGSLWTNSGHATSTTARLSTVQDNCSHTEQLFTYRACNIFTAACGEQTQS